VRPAQPIAVVTRTADQDVLRDGEELVLVRAGCWRLYVPVRHVRRIHPAALPAAHPGAPALAPVIAVDGVLLPVAFAASLAGEPEVRLAPDHQLVELQAGGRRGLLWVDAAEDVVAHSSAAPAPADGALVAGWSGGDRPLPVLDVPRVLDLLQAT
jgi:hypothetical protein